MKRRGRALRRRYGRAQIPKHLRVLAYEITNVVMRDILITPYSLARRFGLPVEKADEIKGLAAHTFGPGGAGFEWMVGKTARIIGRKT
jgi:hypothetical protein